MESVAPGVLSLLCTICKQSGGVLSVLHATEAKARHPDAWPFRFSGGPHELNHSTLVPHVRGLEREPVDQEHAVDGDFRSCTEAWAKTRDEGRPRRAPLLLPVAPGQWLWCLALTR